MSAVSLSLSRGVALSGRSYSDKTGQMHQVAPSRTSFLNTRSANNIFRAPRSRRLVQVNASQSSGEEGGGSSGGPGGGGDEAMVPGGAPMDWRTFRAKLVASNQATQSVSAPTEEQQAVGLEIWQDRMSLENWALLASQNPRLAKEVPWVHQTGGPEAGGVVLAAPVKAGAPIDRRCWQAAVFLVEHGGGSESWGLMLNRPSGYTIQKALAQVNQADASLTVFARSAIYIGGFKSDGRTLYFLHGHDLPGAEEVMPGVYLGGLDAAAEQVLSGKLPPSDFRFFVGRVEWPSGKLQQEIDEGLWYSAACARSLILKQCLQLPKPLWREMLELMGGDFAETARKEYGDLQ